jgi:hypothetical protein
MAEFTVAVTVTLQVEATAIIEAKTKEGVELVIKKMIEEGLFTQIRWTPSPRTAYFSWDEVEQVAQIESIKEHDDAN